MKNIEDCKQTVIDAISDLFSNMEFDEESQVSAFEEIQTIVEDNITTLREQIRSRATDSEG